jgi:competence protein ComEC
MYLVCIISVIVKDWYSRGMGSQRIAWYVIGLAVGLMILVITQLASATATMVVCDVGQGDAILIIKGSTQVLVDGGPSREKILSCLGRYIPFWDRTIELIVLTNTDFDHMHGLGVVLERYQVSQFVTSDGVHSSEALAQFVAILQETEIPIAGVERGDIVRVGGYDGLQLEVLWPPELLEEYVAVFSDQNDVRQREQILGASAKRGDLNERSVVLYLLEGASSVLLTGDIGFQTEDALLSIGGLPDIDYLKVGHHGSKYASSLEFLEALRPEVAVISAGAKNRYGHPTIDVLERLQSVGAELRRTDTEGDVVLSLD